MPHDWGEVVPALFVYPRPTLQGEKRNTMPLPYRVESLEEVPESLREHYEEIEDGAGWRLPVEGVKTEEEIRGLERTLNKYKGKVSELSDKASRFSDEDIEELGRLRKEAAQREEKRAKEEGRWEELRAKLIKEKEGEIDEVRGTLQQREAVIEQLTVTNELRAAIAAAGVKPEYHEAVEALLSRRGPKVTWRDGEMPRGVFPDEVHGDQPIAEYVEAWAESEAAEPYMPPKQAPGGGATGRPGDTAAAPADKEYAEMTPDEKVAYLTAKYGGESAA